MSFQGVRIRDEGEFPKLQFPIVQSWRKINFNRAWRKKACLYTVRPQGRWGALIRQDNILIASHGEIPIDIEWSKVWNMLSANDNVLYGVGDTEFFVGVAVGGVNGPVMPLSPISEDSKVESDLFLPNGDKAVKGQSGASGGISDWPEGLGMPWILKLGTFESIDELEHRRFYMAQTKGYGLWLMTAYSENTWIYEVLV